MPKSRLKKQHGAKSINYKMLFFVLMFALAGLFFGFLAILYPELKKRGVFEDHSFDIFDKLLLEVDEYDYSKGRDLELEKKLLDGWNDEKNLNRKFYYGIAAATYYCNINYIESSEVIFSELYGMIPKNSKKARFDLETHDVFCARRRANAI